MTSSTGRFTSVKSSCVFLALSLAGCSEFQFSGYETFDEWYAAIDRPSDVESVTIAPLEEGSISGYLVNDVLARTPAHGGCEVVRHCASVVALPWYSFRFLLGNRWTSPASGVSEAFSEPERR